MSLYILIHLFFIISLIFIGLKVFHKHKKHSGIFFLISMFCLALWLLLYIFIFGGIGNKEILLYIFRFMYVLSFIGFYSMLFYVYFFGNNIKKIVFKSLFFLSIFILFLFVLTPFMVENLNYIESREYYFEKYGFGYNSILVLYLLFIPLFLLISILKIKYLSYLNQLRLKIIVLGFSLFIFFSLLFYVILPFFSIYLYENIAVIFLLPFILSILYSINKYHFFNFKIGLGKIFIFLLSSFFSIFLINLHKFYYSKLGLDFINFWGISEDFGTVDLILGIILFLISYNYLNKIFLGNNSMIIFERKLNNLRKYIPYITNFLELNNFLQNKFNCLFKINYVNIKIFSKKEYNLELYKYFSKNISRDIFINDLVFIEENKYKFDLELLKKEVKEKSYLIFPLINNKEELIGILEFGAKPFGDQYYTEEINSLKDFANYLLGHLKYLEIYSEINELSINLDKKVDKKTIEYNNLLSKQREFISMSSHEIKTPVASSIFQIDCLIDDINSGKLNDQNIKKDLNILNNQLLKLGELVNKIFTVQEYDIKKIKLFIEKINLEKLLLTEIESFRKVNKKVKINLNLDETVGFIEIDKVQFKQVIDNLLNNTIKFSRETGQIININSKLDNDKVIISIEDNGKGFENIDIKTIFDKYISGNISTIGIGMGLYLCKRIVEMHNGKIEAQNGNELGGAKFIIKIPIKFKKN